MNALPPDFVAASPFRHFTRDEWAKLRAEAGDVLRCVFDATNLDPAEFTKLTRDIQALRRNLERATQP